MTADTQVIWLIVSSLLNSIAYALIAPFVPIELAQGGSTLGLIGLAFCTYPIAVLAFTPLFTRLVGAVPSLSSLTNIISVAIASIGAIFIAYGFLFDKYSGGNGAGGEEDSAQDRAIQLSLTLALRLF